MAISYISPVTYQTYQNTIKAARLVPDTGVAALPAPFGELATIPIVDPVAKGLPRQHPLQKEYPGLVVQYHAVVLRDDQRVERRGVQGWSLYCDYNGSGLCATVVSEMGRNALAPYAWEGKAGSPTDPAALPYMEWRRVQGEDGKFHTWQSYEVHGSHLNGLDWRDGVVENLSTMYDPQRGQVRQSILVPNFHQGLGLAEQTLGANEVQPFYSIMLYFPRPDKMDLVRRLTAPKMNMRGGSQDYDAWPSKGAISFGGVLGVDDLESIQEAPVYRGATRGVERSAGPIKAEAKFTTGGLIKQHIHRDEFGPGLWSERPEALIVLVPMSEQQVREQFGVQYSGGRKGF